ncbi:unnamed protein product, partial [Symbiodinium sp. CCMP2592]
MNNGVARAQGPSTIARHAPPISIGTTLSLTRPDPQMYVAEVISAPSPGNCEFNAAILCSGDVLTFIWQDGEWVIDIHLNEEVECEDIGGTSATTAEDLHAASPSSGVSQTVVEDSPPAHRQPPPQSPGEQATPASTGNTAQAATVINMLRDLLFETAGDDTHAVTF